MLKFVCIAFALWSSLISNAQPDSSFHLYLLVGQSNMAGRGEIDSNYRELQYDNILMLNMEARWVPARHPLHFDKPAIVGVGPGLAFAKTMADAASKPQITKPATTRTLPQTKPSVRKSNSPSQAVPVNSIKIGLVPCAVGGTSIQAWVPGGYDIATKTHPFDDALARIKIAARDGTFKGIIWHQGEADSRPSASSHYLADLKILVERFRSAIGKADLPFVAGELGYFRPAFNLINIELQKLPATIPHTAVASSRDLEHKGDSTHFNSAAADLLGKRMAEKMISLQASKN